MRSKQSQCLSFGLSLGRALLLVLVTLGVGWAVSSTAKEMKSAPQTVQPLQSKGQEEPPLVQLGLEPKAIDMLKAACSRLAAARTMSFTAVTTYESPSRFGTPLTYMTKSEVTLQRPDKLRVLILGDGPASEFYYNGKTMMALAPTENLVAVADAPPTIDAALKVAYDSGAIYFPFADVIVADPYKDLSDGLTIAFYIGQSNVVGGTTTDMIAIANDKVFAQIWIGTEDKLPRMIRAVYADDLARLRHQVEFSNWQLDLAVAGDAFTTTKAGSAKPIPFSNPHPPRTQSNQPALKGNSSKSN
jgi:hypothetical protein